MRAYWQILPLVLAIGGCTNNDESSGVDCVADDVCYKECARDPDCKAENNNDTSTVAKDAGWVSGDEPVQTALNPVCFDGGMPSDVTVIGNSKIVNLTGCLAINGTLTLERSTLTTLEGLSEVKSIAGALIIHDNADLENVNGLENLTDVGGDLSINYNPKLADISGLSRLESIGGDLVFRGNGTLENLNGLQALKTVGGDIYIRGNPNLISLADLASLEFVNGAVKVGQNRSLPTCEAGGAEQSLIQRVHVPSEIVICENKADGCGSNTCPENW